ncbi:hypothetical protein [Pyrococcus sp. ST04]|uniref:hypothetical protein n=1 Tax=Pyrococcus sp. ST04 TaxID=1183377 RepID=UPI0011D1BA87|nr:hypothetical protein [Pyrococcus sp. ST04]
MLEKILKPEFKGKRIKIKGENSEIEDIKTLRNMGFYIIELVGEGYELESLIDQFLFSSFGEYIYIFEKNNRKFLARGFQKLGNPEYLIRDKKGIIRLIKANIKKSWKIIGILIDLALAIGLGTIFGIIHPQFTLIGAMLGAYSGTIITKIIQYYLVGYCKI